jgi:hypothetical protein
MQFSCSNFVALMDKAVDWDPVMVREIEAAYLPCLEILTELQKTAKHMTITSFFFAQALCLRPALTNFICPLWRIRIRVNDLLLLTTHAFTFALEYAIRKVQESLVGLK